ncbi:MAG: hypothetical protein QXZ06_04055 [Candidatus Jordarchaeales archaeon]
MKKLRIVFLPREVRVFEAERRRMKRNARTLVLRGERWMAAASLPQMREVCGHLYGERCCVRLEEREGLLYATIYAATRELAEKVASELEKGVILFRRVEGERERGR